MKSKLISSALALVALFGAAAISNARLARSDESDWNRDRSSTENHHDRHHNPERVFRMGVCVGQALAAAGVTVPPPQPGPRPSSDPTTEAAYKAAFQQCRAELNGTNPTASPVPTSQPTSLPTAGPTTAPTPVPSNTGTD